MTTLTVLLGAVWQSAPLWFPALLGTLAYAAWELHTSPPPSHPSHPQE